MQVLKALKLFPDLTRLKGGRRNKKGTEPRKQETGEKEGKRFLAFFPLPCASFAGTEKGKFPEASTRMLRTASADL